MEYEEARGLRPPGVRPDCTFEVSATKTMAAPVECVFDAFVNTDERNTWLTDGKMSLRYPRSPAGRPASTGRMGRHG